MARRNSSVGYNHASSNSLRVTLLDHVDVSYIRIASEHGTCGRRRVLRVFLNHLSFVFKFKRVEIHGRACCAGLGRGLQHNTTRSAHVVVILLAPPPHSPPYHEISSHGRDSPGTPSDSPAPATRRVVAVILEPPPTQRYSTGVVVAGVSGEQLYHVQCWVQRGPPDPGPSA